MPGAGYAVPGAAHTPRSSGAAPRRPAVPSRTCRGSTALEQARSAGKFTPVHDAWWNAVCRAHGDAEGTRALIEVLLLARHMPHEHVVAGLVAALKAGALTADAVALEARKAADADSAQNYGPELPRRHSDRPDRLADVPTSRGHQAAAVGDALRPAAATAPGRWRRSR